jgi:small-conductance mechanosensitive channel
MNDPMKLVAPLVIFAVTIAIGYLLRRLILRALGAWTARTQSRAGLILTEALRGPMLLWAVILAAHLAIQWSDLPAKLAYWGARALLVLWILSLTIMGMRMARDLVRYYGGEIPGALPVTTLTQNLAQLAVVILGILLMLSALDMKITPILTALGVGGLAVALALQDTLSNLFAGFYVAVSGQLPTPGWRRPS